MDDAVRGDERMAEYASVATCPAEGEVKEMASGQKYCSSSAWFPSCARMCSHEGMICSRSARCSGGMCR